MRSPAAACAWQFGRKHRWGWLAVAGYLLALAVLRLAGTGSGRLAALSEEQSFAATLIVPSAAIFMYLMAVFTFGLEGDLASRRSMYPSRLFTLPVTNAALAGWPMLYGALAMTLLWSALRSLGPWPSDIAVPLIWPGVLAVTILAWTQALTWMPYALPGLRVVVSVCLLVLIDVVAIPALHFGASEGTMVSLLAPQIPLAYVVACVAVARARRGEVPDWRGSLAWGERARRLFAGKRDAFASPAQAQAWFEWRRHGRSLPALVAWLLPFELCMLFVFSDTPSVVRGTLVAVLLTPPFMAAFVAATVGRSGTNNSDSYALTPFLATRPLTSVELLSAKLKAVTWSTLATWLLVAAAVPMALAASGTSWVVAHDAGRVVDSVGVPRAIAIALLALAAVVASTWKRLVHSLYIGMSGRAWLVKGSVFGSLVLLTVAVVLLEWIAKSAGAFVEAWSNLPLALAVLVAIKMGAAGWVVVRLYDNGAVGGRVLLAGAGGWALAALALFGVLLWIVPALLLQVYGLALIAILAVPLVRISAAPLALDWNRHR